ncbi:hypothetical protein LJC10_05735, partial [Selenomonadales bacterium OttesenSCG-928-I06]|nr:hypothetical protein [Selenomonadales bacterium OttesenSCG-928-I06]
MNDTFMEDFYQNLLQQEEVKNVEVRKDCAIEGRKDTHELDVYWQFSDGEIVYTVIVNFKCLNRQLTREDVTDFSKVISDFPGQTVGIIFTEPVYFQEFVTMASSANIMVYEVTPQMPDIYEPLIEKFQIEVDKEWVAEEKKKAGINEEITVEASDSGAMFLYDEKSTCVDNLKSIVDSYLRQKDSRSQEKQKVVHVFETPVFLPTGHELIPFVKIT